MGIKSKRCLTIEEEENIIKDIFNDVPIGYYTKKLIDDRKKRRVNQEGVDEFIRRALLPDEKYITIEYRPDYIYTNKGRVLNTHTKKQISATISATRVLHMINQHTFSYVNINKITDWDLTYEGILANYVEYGWKHRLSTIYRMQVGKDNLQAIYNNTI